MPTTKYEKGRAFEYTIRNKLRAKGYYVIRAAGSKPIDLVAIRNGEVILVECKKNKKNVTQTVKDYLTYLGKTLNVKTIIAYKDKGRITIEIIYDPQES